MLGSGAAVLNPDRADLYLEAVVLENDPVVIVGLGVDHVTQIQISVQQRAGNPSDRS